MVATPPTTPRVGPLTDVVVLDLGQALSGPFAASLLADWGADVISVESIGGGRSLRGIGPKKGPIPLWWKCAARNKRSIEIDFQNEAGREVLLDLVRHADVFVENFRAGTLEKRDLGWEVLHEVNPRLIMLRVSGYGQFGPKAGFPGFGRIGESMSGAVQLTGDRGGAPRHVGFSLADASSGILGATAVLAALHARDRDGIGDCIDLALYESLFRMIDWQVIAHDQLGVVPERAGSNFPDVLSGTSAGVEEASDGVWITYSAASDAVLVRLIKVVADESVLAEERFSSAEHRRENSRDIDRLVASWIGSHTSAEVLAGFQAGDVPATRVYDVAAIMDDDVIRARDGIVRIVDGDLGEVAMHGIVPRFERNPGAVWRTGPNVGEHTDEVLRQFLGLSDTRLDELKAAGAIASTTKESALT